MKHIFPILSILASVIMVSCTKHSGDIEQNIPAYTINFSSPTISSVYHNGDSVTIHLAVGHVDVLCQLGPQDWNSISMLVSNRDPRIAGVALVLATVEVVRDAGAHPRDQREHGSESPA